MGVLGTGSSAFTHNEGGTKFHGLQFKAEARKHTVLPPYSSSSPPPLSTHT